MNNSQSSDVFFYDEYLNNHSESKYLMDFISLVIFVQIFQGALNDFINNYDFIHKQLGSTAFIPLRSSSVKPVKVKCGKDLSFHSKYFDKSRNHFRTKYVCSNPSDCPLNRSNCYR